MPSAADVETFLANYPPEVRDVALAARSLLAVALPDVTETLDESARILGYSYRPGYKGVVCTLILSRSGVKLGIVRGSELPDPKQLMVGSGKVHRHVQLRSTADLKRAGMKPLLKAALTAWRERNEVNG
jgi:hypothetical protein